MARRSLQASAQGIKKAKQAFKRKGWTQEYLAAEVGLETRQSIWKFFTGKPIDRHVFHDICFALELEISEIAQQPGDDEYVNLDTLVNITIDIDTLVENLRSIHHQRIQSQCATLQLLDIGRPINLLDIYVDTSILEEIPSQRYLDIHHLHQISQRSNSSYISPVSSTLSNGLQAVEKYSRLMVLGKPGSGKTTFLQSVALSCTQGTFRPNYLPIFVNLKNFAEEVKDTHQLSLFRYIHDNLMNCMITEVELNSVLLQGRALILLDGLDEIILEESGRTLQKVSSFINKFYKNNIIISSRTFSHYPNLHGFTVVEIAGFNKQEIGIFAIKWFAKVAKISPETSRVLAYKFIQKLELVENAYILELAANPLILSFLCLVFESVADFPGNHFEIYKKVLDLLLIRWDEVKGIKRYETIPTLSSVQKLKLLSYIAINKFYRDQEFYTEDELQQTIIEFLHILPNYTNDIDALNVDSLKLLQAIELQHGLITEKARGIYAFSYSIFHKYFTARAISTHTDKQVLADLVNNLSEKRWRELFLLTVWMSKPVDELLELIKRKIYYLPNKNVKIDKFLQWVEQKSSQVTCLYNSASVRAFYFTIALPPEHPLARNQDLAISLEQQFAGSLSIGLALDLALTHALAVSLTMTADIFFIRLSALNLALDLKHLLVNELSLEQCLEKLKQQLPKASKGTEALKAWWTINGQSWTEQLRDLMINSRNIGYDWQFNEEDIKDLQEYWEANKLLIDCLQISKNISFNLRCHLENNLFLSKS